MNFQPSCERLTTRRARSTRRARRSPSRCARADGTPSRNASAIRRSRTVADVAAQVACARALRGGEGEDFVGEETTRALDGDADVVTAILTACGAGVDETEARERLRETSGGIGRYWVCDPLDGTKAFAASDDDADKQYVLGLALMSDVGTPEIAVMIAPKWPGGGLEVVAARGRGGVSLARATTRRARFGAFRARSRKRCRTRTSSFRRTNRSSLCRSAGRACRRRGCADCVAGVCANTSTSSPARRRFLFNTQRRAATTRASILGITPRVFYAPKRLVVS